MAYVVLACVVMVYIVMADIVMAADRLLKNVEARQGGSAGLEIREHPARDAQVQQQDQRHGLVHEVRQAHVEPGRNSLEATRLA